MDLPETRAAMMNKAVCDYYRCPPTFLDFKLREGLSDEPVFFSFGTNTTCYGRSCSTSTEKEVWLDTAITDQSNGDRLSLPFDPTEVIDNLRLERYVNRSNWQESLRKLYYIIRPFSTPPLRRTVQRFSARNWQNISFPQWPVDTTVESICEQLMLRSMKAKMVDRVPFVWFWPRGARGCVTMTHDVETELGLNFCDQVMDLDRSAQIKASFQIVPEQRYAVNPEFLEQIRSRGFEVCIQDLNHDGRLFDDREEFVRRARVINQYGRMFAARGFRAGVLYRRPEWYDMLEFSFDMSLPNVAHLDPQQGGCCTVSPFFIGQMLEVPVTTTQDYTLFHILEHRGIDLWKTQTEMILKKNGLASFIVHPDYLLEPELRALYIELLHYLCSLREGNDLWFALPSEIDRWWRARDKMQVVQDGQLWRVTGEGSEQATLAFAQIEEDRLAYKVTAPRMSTASAEPAKWQS